jgi:Rrf2 family protein
MRVPAKVDYAIQAAAELATAGPGRLKSGQIAKAQQLPPKFPENILSELKHAGIVESHRGAEGGYQLGRPADQITLADIIRAVDGPLAKVRETRPQSLPYPEPASQLVDVWIAARVSLRSVLEHVILADLVAGTLPGSVRDLTKDPDAWISYQQEGSTASTSEPARTSTASTRSPSGRWRR